jgi:hypothetical protein
MNLNQLRMLIVLSWLIYIAEVLTVQFYDPALHSPALQLSKTVLEKAVIQDYAFYSFLAIEATLIIYASAALWFGYLSGKWAYLLYIFFALTDAYFVSVQAFSSFDIIWDNTSFFIIGIIALALFSSPLKEKLSEKKPFYFWKVFITFFIFFILFFGLPLSFSYL